MKKNNILKIVLFSAFLGLITPKLNYAVDNTYKQLETLIDMLQIIKKDYVEDIDTSDLIHGAARGMVDELDEFSQYMEEDVYQRVKSDTEGEFGGIGIKLEIKDKLPTIITPIPNTPAFKAGLYPGDKIIKIQEEETRNMVIDDVVKRLRGKPGTKVKITILREPEKKDEDWITKEVELKREKIKSEVIKYKMLPSNIGYIKVSDFSAHLIEEFSKALKSLQEQNMKALIIDLRYNPGGLLLGAVDLSKFFLSDEKMIVYTKGRKDSNYQEFKSDKIALYPDIPVAVLINRYSASASEIFAGAMQDNKRALIIGENSFGKASVQQIMPLADGSALRLTIAHYYTPNGNMIHRNPKTLKGGIIPDIEVKVPREDEIKLLESSEEIFYPNEKKEKQQKIKEEKNKVQDKVLDKAEELLKAMEILSNTNSKK